MERHVGKSADYLADRLKGGAAGATSYYNKDAALKGVNEALNQNQQQVSNWFANSQRLNFEIRWTSPSPLGHGYPSQGSDYMENLYTAIVVLRRDGSEGYYVYTSYLE